MENWEIFGYRAVVGVQPLPNYQLQLTFETGEIRVFDVKPYFDSPVFAPLQEPEKFAEVSVCLDTITWPDEVDIAPETLYSDSIPIEQYEQETGQPV